MNFSDVLYHLRRGYRMSRESWQDHADFIFLVEDSQFKVNRQPLLSIFPEGTEISYMPHIDIGNTRTNIVKVWTPQQSDLLSDDWKIVGKNS